MRSASPPRPTASARRSGTRRRQTPSPSCFRPTLETFAAEHMERHSPRWKPSNTAVDTSFLKSAILPAFGHLRVGSVVRADVARVFHEYGRRKAEAANAVMRCCVPCWAAPSPGAIGPKPPGIPIRVLSAIEGRRAGGSSARTVRRSSAWSFTASKPEARSRSRRCGRGC